MTLTPLTTLPPLPASAYQAVRQGLDPGPLAYTIRQMQEYAAAAAADVHSAYCHSQQQFLDATAEIERLRSALRMTLMLERLGGMLPGTHELVQMAVAEAKKALKAPT